MACKLPSGRPAGCLSPATCHNPFGTLLDVACFRLPSRFLLFRWCTLGRCGCGGGAGAGPGRRLRARGHRAAVPLRSVWGWPALRLTLRLGLVKLDVQLWGLAQLCGTTHRVSTGKPQLPLLRHAPATPSHCLLDPALPPTGQLAVAVALRCLPSSHHPLQMWSWAAKPPSLARDG